MNPAPDPITGASIAVLHDVHHTITQNGWDQPPILFALYRTLTPNGFSLMVHPLVSPDVFTTGRTVTDVLARITNAVNNGLTPPPQDGDLTVLALTTEAWLTPTDPTQERQEARYTTAVDTAGITYVVQAIRGDEDTRATYTSQTHPNVTPPAGLTELLSELTRLLDTLNNVADQTTP